MKRGLVTFIHVRIYCDACGAVYTDPGITPEMFEPEDLGACFHSRAAAVAWIAGHPQGWTYDGDRVLCEVCHDTDITDIDPRD